MRAYIVEGGGKRKYVGTMAHASAAKKELVAGGLKRKDVSVTETEVPTDKQGLLAFINGLVQG